MKNKFSQILNQGRNNARLMISKSWFHFLLIAFTAAVVRIPMLARPYPLSFDDGVYAMSIIHIERGLEPFEDVFSSQGPYFLTLISLPTQVFGTSPLALRLVPFLSGIVLAILSYMLIKRFACTKWALTTGLLVAVSGSILRTTTPITSDGIVAVFILLTVLITYKFLEKESLVNAIYLGAVIGIGCGIKNVFMIPALLFVLIATRNTSFRLRLIAGIISLAFFFAPMTYFGIKDSLEQSIFYHLGKNAQFDVGGNISKLLTTFSSFDIYLLILVPIAMIIGLKSLYKNYKRNESFKSFIKTIFDPQLPYLFIVGVCGSSFVLIILQTPMFRNHLAIIIAPLIISVICLIQSLSKRNSSLEFGVVALVCLLGVVSIINVYNDPLIKQSNDMRNAIAELEKIPSNSIILTNEPGIAFASNLDVPTGLEDTSRFRFLNNNEELRVTRSDFEEILATDERICAFVVSPLPISKEIELNKIAPKTWNQVLDSGYQIWINPSRNCKK